MTTCRECGAEQRTVVSTLEEPWFDDGVMMGIKGRLAYAGVRTNYCNESCTRNKSIGFTALGRLEAAIVKVLVTKLALTEDERTFLRKWLSMSREIYDAVLRGKLNDYTLQMMAAWCVIEDEFGVSGQSRRHDIWPKVRELMDVIQIRTIPDDEAFLFVLLEQEKTWAYTGTVKRP